MDQKVAQFVKINQFFSVDTNCPKIRTTSVIIKKLPKENNRPIYVKAPFFGENIRK
jgi:hypothetical protein